MHQRTPSLNNEACGKMDPGSPLRCAPLRPGRQLCDMARPNCDDAYTIRTALLAQLAQVCVRREPPHDGMIRESLERKSPCPHDPNSSHTGRNWRKPRAIAIAAIRKKWASMPR